MKDEQFGVRRQRRRFGSCFIKSFPKVDPKRRRLYVLPPHSELTLALVAILLVSSVQAQQLSRDDWGGMPVTVSHQGANWNIAGKKHQVSLNERDLSMTIQTGAAKWPTVGSSAHDLRLKTGAEEFAAGLTQAKQIQIVPYDAGFKTGVKISLSGWSHNSTNIDLQLFLTVCHEGRDEDLVFEVAASEDRTTVRQLDW